MHGKVDVFEWSPELPLADWKIPLCTAIAYLFVCLVSNASLRRRGRQAVTSPSKIFIAVSAAHNVALIAISLFLAIGTTRELIPYWTGLYDFVCPLPVPVPQPLGGPVHAWTYLTYVSKYYELLDTAFIIVRRRRVIPLHMFHHASMPMAMWLMFYGEQMQSLIGVAVVNSSVHVVMYFYYLVTVIHPDLVLPRAKRAVTQLQLLQFSVGLLGNMYWFSQVLAELQWTSSGFHWKSRCRGNLGIGIIALSMNLMLTLLFSQFYVKTYLKASNKRE